MAILRTRRSERRQDGAIGHGAARFPTAPASAREHSDPNRVHRLLRSFRDGQRAMEESESEWAPLTDRYFDLATDMYEFGWGDSFHFAPRYASETHRESLVRHQHWLALKLALGPGMHLLDVGCGVGGPMRNIARLVHDVEITGITINAYQVKRGQAHIETAGFGDRCRFVHGDFMAMPLDDSIFDRAYALDATPHAPDRRRVYSEVFRVLRPGGLFGCFEWCTTDRYDPGNAEHRAVIRTIERANVVRAVPMAAVGEALAECGFDVLEARDVPDRGDAETPWYWPFVRSGGGIRAFAISAPGARVMGTAIKTLERLRVAPRGSGETWEFLREGGTALLRAGELGIFTPHYFFLARKPASV